MVNQEMKLPGWVRALSIIFGILTLIFAFAIVALPTLGLLTIVLWTVITLISAGLGRIAIGLGVPNLSGGIKALNVIAGILAIVLAFVAWGYPDLTIGVQIILFGVSLLFTGIAQVSFAGLGNLHPTAPKWLLIILGILSIVFSFIVIAVPGFGETVLVTLLALGLLMQSIDSISVGVSGQGQ